MGHSLWLSACSSSSCDEADLKQVPAFVVPLEGFVEDGKCTVYGYAVGESAGQQQLLCYAGLESICNCYGGTIIDDYQVEMYSVASGEQIDEAEISVKAAPANTCRLPELTAPFTGALRGTTLGVGGLGGAGGAGGQGGQAALGGGGGARD